MNDRKGKGESRSHKDPLALPMEVTTDVLGSLRLQKEVVIVLNGYLPERLLEQVEGIDVYLALEFDPSKKRQLVVVKVAERSDQRIRGEISYWEKLNCAYMMELTDSFYYDKYAYFVHTYYTHGTVNQMVSASKSDQAKANELMVRKWIKQVLIFINRLHTMGLFHLNISKRVLYIDNNWDLKVGGFGYMTMYNDNHALLGTIDHVAPEVLETWPYATNHDLSKIDMWAVGGLVCELMCGFSISGPVMGTRLSDRLNRRLIIINNVETLMSQPEIEALSRAARSFIGWILKISPDNRPSARRALRHPWIRDQEIRNEISGLDRALSKITGRVQKIIPELSRTDHIVPIVNPEGVSTVRLHQTTKTELPAIKFRLGLSTNKVQLSKHAWEFRDHVLRVDTPREEMWNSLYSLLTKTYTSSPPVFAQSGPGRVYHLTMHHRSKQNTSDTAKLTKKDKSKRSNDNGASTSMAAGQDCGRKLSIKEYLVFMQSLPQSINVAKNLIPPYHSSEEAKNLEMNVARLDNTFRSCDSDPSNVHSISDSPEEDDSNRASTNTSFVTPSSVSNASSSDRQLLSSSFRSLDEEEDDVQMKDLACALTNRDSSDYSIQYSTSDDNGVSDTSSLSTSNSRHEYLNVFNTNSFLGNPFLTQDNKLTSTMSSYTLWPGSSGMHIEYQVSGMVEDEVSRKRTLDDTNTESQEDSSKKQKLEIDELTRANPSEGKPETDKETNAKNKYKPASPAKSISSMISDGLILPLSFDLKRISGVSFLSRLVQSRQREVNGTTRNVRSAFGVSTPMDIEMHEEKCRERRAAFPPLGIKAEASKIKSRLKRCWNGEEMPSYYINDIAILESSSMISISNDEENSLRFSDLINLWLGKHEELHPTQDVDRSGRIIDSPPKRSVDYRAHLQFENEVKHKPRFREMQYCTMQEINPTKCKPEKHNFF